MPETLYKNLKM